MSNKTYDILKWVAQFLLPGLATLYFALSNIWPLPYGEEIVGTIVAFNAFLGVLLGISTAQYKKLGDIPDGTLQIDSFDPTKDTYRLSLDTGLDEIKKKKHHKT